MADDELKTILREMRQQSAAAHEETRRHFDATAEVLRSEIRVVAESVMGLNDRLDRFAATIEETLGDIKAMIKFSHAERLESPAH